MSIDRLIDPLKLLDFPVRSCIIWLSLTTHSSCIQMAPIRDRHLEARRSFRPDGKIGACPVILPCRFRCKMLR